MAAVLGLDIGTTGTKAVLVDEHFRIVAHAYKAYDFIANDNGYVEQNADDWWQAAVYTIGRCVEKAGSCDIKGISLSSQGATLVCVDKKGVPLSPAIVWMDGRAGSQGDSINQRYGKDFVYNKTGWRSQNCFNFLQMLWIKQNNPDLYNQTDKFLSTVEYINYKLTGEYVGDPSNAAISELYNITQKKWDQELLEILEIDESKLARIIDSGKLIGGLCKSAAEELGLPTTIPVFNGCHDQYMAAVGVGAVSNGDILLSCGTSWCITHITDSLIFDNINYSSPGLHVLDKLYGVIAYTPAGGAALEWFRKNMFRSDGVLSYSQLDEIAEKSPPGANGVMFLPHFSGTSYPTWSNNSRATLMGLNLTHGQSDIVRSILEGVGFEINWVLEGIKTNVAGNCVMKALGGAAKSPLWMQIISDISGLGVCKSTVADAPVIGAAITAGVSGGIYENASNAAQGFNDHLVFFEPNLIEHEKYAALFEEYKRRFYLLKECYS